MAPQPYLDIPLWISVKLTGDVEAPTLRRYHPGISLYNSTKSSQHYSLLILPQGVGGPTRWFVNLFEAPLHLYGLRFPT